MNERFNHLDLEGHQPLPFSLHLCLWALMRGYILLALALASRQQSETLLSLFYPDPHQLYLALALGLPAALTWLASGHRQRPAAPLHHWIWRHGRWLCLGSASGELGLQLWQLQQQGWFFSWPQAASLGVGIWCLSYLLLAKGLRHAFVITLPSQLPDTRLPDESSGR
ncbi:MAG: DUF2919 family protein [Aeromonadaceae bacterium]